MIQSGTDFRKEKLPFLAASSLSALLLALAMPGRFGWWPLLFTALVPLLLFIAGNRPGRSFLAGFLAGFMYYVALLYWIVIVLDRYGAIPVGLAVAAMILLSAYMGMYMGFFSAILSLATGKGKGKENIPASIVVLAPFLWVGLDWARGLLFTGFPWMDLGYGLYAQPRLIQFADIGGHHLVTFCLVLINTLIIYVLSRSRFGVHQSRQPGNRVAAAACLILMLLAVYSVYRYPQVKQIVRESGQERVAVVQGDISQDEKWTPAALEATLEKYRILTERGVQNGNTNLVVWPETALPFYPVNDPLFYSVTGFAEEQKIWLLTGAPYYTVNTDFPKAGRELEYFNSALLISPEGRMTDRYSKQHLVPFGEYVPLSRYLFFLEPIVVHVGNFTPGDSSAPLSFGKVKAGVLICFESIFADLARRQTAAGANILVNLTNDAWYGRSSAPHQSFAMSVFRSVETRRSLVRAANTGISGFVDPLGRVLEKSPLFEPLVLTATVPLVEKQSFFTRYGFAFGPGCFILAPFLFFLLRKKKANIL
ncbi:MAG: apolipoprotein N-acyltransferase [Desulfobulbaceae bacterium]|nr:apolipoprotein N-acyltransferase [Desulfobulbaceae bacterium]